MNEVWLIVGLVCWTWAVIIAAIVWANWSADRGMDAARARLALTMGGPTDPKTIPVADHGIKPLAGPVAAHEAGQLYERQRLRRLILGDGS